MPDDDPGALHEDLAHAGRDHQVDVALPVALLHVGEAVPLLRERADGLGEDGEGGRLHGQLAGLGPGGRPLGAHHVADVEQLEDLEAALADLVLLHPDLEVAAAVPHLEEGGLAEGRAGEDAAGHRPGAGVLGDDLGRRGAVAGVELGGQVARGRARCRRGSPRGHAAPRPSRAGSVMISRSVAPRSSWEGSCRPSLGFDWENGLAQAIRAGRPASTENTRTGRMFPAGRFRSSAAFLQRGASSVGGAGRPSRPDLRRSRHLRRPGRPGPGVRRSRRRLQRQPRPRQHRLGVLERRVGRRDAGAG